MLTMPHLPSLQWDYADRLHEVTLDANNNKAYYAYNSGGERTRKVVVKGNTTEERIYFGDYEIYRKTINQQLDFERHTHHVNDDTKKVALNEYKTVENGLSLQVPVVTVRYQYDNHLGSASLELDEGAQLITYEEYHPFGTSSYRAGRSLTETSLKRYKYVDKERDEETGLYYYGMRYYADWLCRFVSVDPLQFKYTELTPFQYASNRPVSGIDLDGLEYYATNEIRIKIVDNEVLINLDNFNTVTRNAWKERDKKETPPNGDIGWSRKYAQINWPNLPLERVEVSLDRDAFNPLPNPAENPSQIRKFGERSEGGIDNRVKAPIGGNIPAAKTLAKVSLLLNAINWGLETYGNFQILEDKQLVDKQYYTYNEAVLKDISSAITIGGYIPEKYMNTMDLAAISNVILSGVNPTNDEEIYKIGIRIVKEISKNYRVKYDYVTMPISNEADNTTVVKQIKVPQTNEIEFTKEQQESLKKCLIKTD